MQAAILMEPGKLELRETPTPECPEGGVLVKVKACGICSADAKMITKGHRTLVYPRILGHEIAGIVAESRSSKFKAGDRVQVAPGLKCGRCLPCCRGEDNQCENREILGFTRDGGYAEYLAVPLKGIITGALNLLPGNVSYVAATLGEPIACCINAQNKIGIKNKDAVLIFGGGPLGLLHCAVARINGAGNILIAETQAHRRELALAHWADKAIDPINESLEQKVMELTNERGVDVMIFACSEICLDDGRMKLLSRSGRVSIFSGTSPQLSRIEIDSNFIHYNEVIIGGAYGCSALQNAEAIGLIAAERFDIDRLITQKVNLENIHQGLDHTLSNTALKSIMEV